MSKYGRSQRRESRRAAKAAAAAARERWWPPPDEECDPSEAPTPYHLSETSRITQRILRREGRVVDYAVQHEGKLSDGTWATIARIDCDHAEVHLHLEYPGAPPRQILREIYSQGDVEATCQSSYDYLFENWEENERRWESGQANRAASA